MLTEAGLGKPELKGLPELVMRWKTRFGFNPSTFRGIITGIPLVYKVYEARLTF